MWLLNHSLIVKAWVPLVLVCLWAVRQGTAVSTFPIVLIVSMDGFRPDYIDDCWTPTIAKLRSSGAQAPYMRNVFPTKTLPNHYSIATGVHPEVHGVLDSTVYVSKDGCSNRTVIGYSYDLFHYNNDILPIWSLNQLAGKGRHSGVMMWPGGEFSYGCKKTIPTFTQKFNLNISFESRIDTVISWLTHPKTPANLVLLYLQEPDLHGHAFGIDSPEVRQQIKNLDRSIEYLNNQLKVYDLDKVATVFVVSDHGMINVDQKNIINLEKHIDSSSFIHAGASPVLQIFPKDGKEKEILSGLQKAHDNYRDTFDFYLQDKIPSMWHYANNNRTPPILVVAREGYVFQDFYDTIDAMNKNFHIEPNPRNKYGVHGYSNTLPSMHPLFFAWGPLVKAGTVLDPFNTTELYLLWAFILDLEVDHEVSSAPDLIMLLQKKMASNYPMTPTDNTLSIVPGITSNHTGSPTLNGNQIQGGAPHWMYWFSGLIAILILFVIIGVIVYFCKDLQRTNAVPSLPTYNRSSHFVDHPCPCRCHHSSPVPSQPLPLHGRSHHNHFV